MTIAENLAAVESRISAACARAGRKRSDVTLVAVSKTFGADRVDEAIAAGVTHIGENRVQEARDKKPQVRRNARWHLIGHLQSNKAKDAVRIFDVIETVDSVELAQKIARASDPAASRAPRSGRTPAFVDGDERGFRDRDRGRLDDGAHRAGDFRRPRLRWGFCRYFSTLF